MIMLASPPSEEERLFLKDNTIAPNTWPLEYIDVKQETRAIASKTARFRN